MKKSPLVLIMLGLLSLSVFFHGCSESTIDPVEHTVFDVSEYNTLEKEGGGIVTGRAFIKTRNGDVKTLAGETVRLRRKGIYSDQWLEIASNRKVHTAAYDYRLEDYVFMTKADTDGRFTFEDVPAGEYYLTTKITWFTPDDIAIGSFRKDITVENGKTLDVVLRR